MEFYLLLSLIATVLWGLHAFGAKLVTRYIAPEAGAFLGYAVGTICMALYLLCGGIRFPLNKFSLYASLIGVFLGIAMMLFYKALAIGPASVVVPITGLYMLIPSILGFVFLREKLSISRIAGIVFAALAIYLLSIE